MKSCRILLVDDHVLLMEGVRSFLATHRDLRVIGMASNGKEAINLTALHNPHIIILDISMPDMHGIEIAKAVRAVCPQTKILIYTMHTDQRFLLELIQLGIMGHVTKGEPSSVLLHAIQALRKGQVFLSSNDHSGNLHTLMREKAASPPDVNITTLSPREKEVFHLLADGQSIRYIAEFLHISPKTVENHKYNLLCKLQVNSLSALTKIAIRHGFVHI